MYVYITQSHRNLPSHKKYDFFSFRIWEGETVSRIEFSVEEKKIENVMKKEAQISDIIYACFS